MFLVLEFEFLFLLTLKRREWRGQGVIESWRIEREWIWRMFSSRMRVATTKGNSAEGEWEEKNRSKKRKKQWSKALEKDWEINFPRENTSSCLNGNANCSRVIRGILPLYLFNVRILVRACFSITIVYCGFERDRQINRNSSRQEILTYSIKLFPVEVVNVASRIPN